MKSYSNKLLIIAGIASKAVAFQVPPSHHAIHRTVQLPPLASAAELSPIDEMCIENVAEFCLHESCDIEEYEALVNQLEEQRDHFIRHVANVESLLHRLKDSNHPEHDSDEVKELIGNIKHTLESPPKVGADESDYDY